MTSIGCRSVALCASAGKTIISPHRSNPNGPQAPHLLGFGAVTQAARTLAYPPAMMPADEAARYLGIPKGKFERLVAAGDIAGPFNVEGSRIWARVDLDAYVDALLGVVPRKSDWREKLRAGVGR